MKQSARRWWVLVLTMAMSGVLVSAAIPAVGDDAVGASGYVVVELNSPGAAKYTGGINGIASTHPQNGRFDPSSPAYAAYRKHLENEHANFRAALGRHAPQATVVHEYYVTANAIAVELNGTNPQELRRLNGVRNVWDSGLYRPTMDESVGLIGAPEAWPSVGGQSSAGDGVRVAVIDSGIVDSLIPGFHPFFSCKAVEFGGFYYSGVTGSPAIGISQGVNPAPGVAFVSPHGTHVAGTVGGCVTTIGAGVWDGVSLSGVAPGATLVDYNVFPGIGAGYVAFDGSAFSHDIAAAIEDAVLNGDHVINMSLGGGAQGPNDFLAQVSNGAVAAGVVVVTSAGNTGPGSYTVGSPGVASEVIAVGATTNARGMAVVIETDEATYGAVPGEFPDFAGISYAVIEWPGSDPLACVGDASGLSGEVVLISRGVCSFSEKVANAKAAGAGGVIVYNNVPGDPIGMARTPGFDDDLPAVMVSLDDGLDLIAAAPTTAVITPPTVVSTVPNLLADFSSRGPAPFTGIVKPDVVAPGVDILSSTFAGWELYNGTSMASPHVAGAAAVLLQANPGWTPARVKSALATTATDLGLEVWEQGSGLIDLAAALEANAFFTPTNASFGVFQGKKPANGSIAIDVDSAATCAVESIGGTAASFISASVDGSTLTVDFTGGRDAASGMHGGLVIVDCDGQDHAIPYGVVVDRKD